MSGMSYAATIAAIDAAILKWADKPITLAHQWRSTTYRDLDQLIRAREYYTKLEAGTQPGR